MAGNRIKIRHGSTEPTTDNLLPYELGWDGTHLALYINNNGTKAKVGGEGLFLPLTGGVLTGNIEVHKNSAVNITSKNTALGTQIILHASASADHGIYSTGYYNGSSYVVNGSWLVYRNSSGNVVLNGNAATATKLATARTLWGNSFDGTGNIEAGLHIFPASGSQNEGLRIHSAPSGYATIAMCGTENTSWTGTSENTWALTTYGGNISLTRNGNALSSTGTAYLKCASNVWSWNGTADGSISGNAATATTAKGLWLGGIGNSTTTHATALQNYFNSYKDSIPRNQLLAFSDSTGDNSSITFGYFITGYDSGPYGGFYCAHYNTPYYIGILAGIYTQWALIRDSGSTARKIWVVAAGTTTPPSGSSTGDIVLVKAS